MPVQAVKTARASMADGSVSASPFEFSAAAAQDSKRKLTFSGQQNTNTFIGTITAAVSPDRFFAPENIERILSANVAGQNTLGPD
jgi:hypothetical protein